MAHIHLTQKWGCPHLTWKLEVISCFEIFCLLLWITALLWIRWIGCWRIWLRRNREKSQKNTGVGRRHRKRLLSQPHSLDQAVPSLAKHNHLSESSCIVMDILLLCNRMPQILIPCQSIIYPRLWDVFLHFWGHLSDSGHSWTEASAGVSYDPPMRTGTCEANERKTFCSRFLPIIVSGGKDSTQSLVKGLQAHLLSNPVFSDMLHGDSAQNRYERSASSSFAV